MCLCQIIEWNITFSSKIDRLLEWHLLLAFGTDAEIKRLGLCIELIVIDNGKQGFIILRCYIQLARQRVKRSDLIIFPSLIILRHDVKQHLIQRIGVPI
ncbi:hypothetical protein SDC9_90895 [bioreactor metagenome]|uniref:Uncharacterized protein n=1 Tax=bioreactor metagenome TaxID=1076179 RepID=A0A644ZTX5_9ZZZZ